MKRRSLRAESESASTSTTHHPSHCLLHQYMQALSWCRSKYLMGRRIDMNSALVLLLHNLMHRITSLLVWLNPYIVQLRRRIRKTFLAEHHHIPHRQASRHRMGAFCLSLPVSATMCRQLSTAARASTSPSHRRLQLLHGIISSHLDRLANMWSAYLTMTLIRA